MQLERIEYQAGNYALAAKHYKIANKKKMPNEHFGVCDLHQFAYSLRKDGHLKEAQKQLKKSSRTGC
jgi:hypothetical protein